MANMDIAAAVAAVGEWSHLSLFPSGHRAIMAGRCGLRPDLQKFVRYRMFMVSDAKLARLAFRYSESRHELAVWESDVAGDGDRGLSEARIASFPRDTVVVGWTPDFAAGLAMTDGWCYLTMPTSDGRPLRDLGRYPTVETLVSHGVSFEVLMGLRFVRPGLMHYHPHVTVKVGGAAAREGRGEAVVAEQREVVLPSLPSVGAARAPAVEVVREPLASEPVRSLLAGQDPTTCKCAVHVSVHDVVPGLQRSPLGAGVHPVIRAAVAGEHAVCHATPEVRELDGRFAALVFGGKLAERVAYAQGGVSPEMKHLLSSNRAAVEIFDKGYCYLRAVRGDARWRVARVLGPAPLAVDVLSVLPWVGAKAFSKLRLSGFEGNLCHVEEVDPVAGRVWDGAGVAFYKALSAAAYENPRLRVGVNSSAMVAYLPPSRASVPGGHTPASDMAIALTPVAELTSAARNRKRMLEVVGDAALTTACAERVFAVDGTPQQYQELRSSRLSNAALGRAFERQNFYSLLQFPEATRGTVTTAKACEAVAGVLHIWDRQGGFEAYIADLRLFD